MELVNTKEEEEVMEFLATVKMDTLGRCAKIVFLFLFFFFKKKSCFLQMI